MAAILSLYQIAFKLSRHTGLIINTLVTGEGVKLSPLGIIRGDAGNLLSWGSEVVLSDEAIIGEKSSSHKANKAPSFRGRQTNGIYVTQFIPYLGLGHLGHL